MGSQKKFHRNAIFLFGGGSETLFVGGLKVKGIGGRLLLSLVRLLCTDLFERAVVINLCNQHQQILAKPTLAYVFLAKFQVSGLALSSDT